MKRYYIFLLIIILIGACKKETTSTRLVTPTFPVITLKGSALVSAGVGGTYTDPGATVFDSITNTTSPLAPTSNNVDLSTTGFYSVSFNAINVWGYRSAASRMVLVTTVSPADDISGVYHRTSNGATVNIVKVGTGAYQLDNVGGVLNNPAFVFPFFIGFTDASTFQGPPQNTPLGQLSIDNTSITRSGSTIKLKYVVHNPNFGTSVRTFIRN
ncbi:uncharacterized protein DUF5011 [Chitinophaga niastensis]|uniref:Uncharacterized protein DUF5011 n=1 Tax=Chitinophaga niastensis TaxID=536980 RepID=A0A2P8HCC7_CHINA|nr:immunoglobulin-like domain-containing protein [Chitinophaga niastensis]PSL43822.1 uncharacterized protein DUF5011 [Chitinophaga niastensis]